MRFIATALALMWLVFSVAWFSAGKEWEVPLAAAVGWGAAAIAEWQIVSLRNTVKRLASGGRWRA